MSEDSMAGKPLGGGAVKPCHLGYQISLRSDLKADRSSAVNNSGYSQAAKCPPLGSYW